ncbi:unnamed protein product [Adineta ricciae]|uniref:RING-type domain-containing protein n=1 Tax=Adineta ricciae TaxID=249248 RepID=A0A813XDQ1_ADIRI|nr:unnamed protein product [Adineta ricciae]CAF1613029.1 unnamed protein product [Adineta ricciae]
MTTTNESSSSQMERLTTCPVCLDKFRSPKVLPCMHTFCLTPCLTNLVDPRSRVLRCPECRREHLVPPGGVQGFPANLTMIGFLDLQPNTTSQPDRCSVCREQKQNLAKCHDCSKPICSECRESHLRETSYNVSSLVSQLRRSLPKLSDKIASYEQRVNSVQTTHEQIQREITAAIAMLIEDLKHRETALFTEAEVYMQSQLRMFRLQQETAEVELASVASFCESLETSLASGQTLNDVDLANMRSQCNRYSEQIHTLETQMPTDVQKLRFTSENQTAISSTIHEFGRLIDITAQTSTNHPRHTSTGHPNSAPNYATTISNPVYMQDQSPPDTYRHLENIYYSRGPPPMLVRAHPPSQAFTYRPAHNHFSGSFDNPFVDLNFTVPVRPHPHPTSSSYIGSWHPQANRRALSIFGTNPFTSNNSRPSAPPTSESTPRRTGRSIEGDDRPILGGGRDRAQMPAPVQEQEPTPPVNRQRRGTFVLDEASLPNLPQSGAQRPRDPINVQDLYNVRPRDRAQTPVAFTINMNEVPQPPEDNTS